MFALQSAAELSSSSDFPVDADSADSFQDVQAPFQVYVNIERKGGGKSLSVVSKSLLPPFSNGEGGGGVGSLPFLGISIHFDVSCGREVQNTNGKFSSVQTSHNVPPPFEILTFLLLFPLHDVS